MVDQACLGISQSQSLKNGNNKSNGNTKQQVEK